MKVEIFEVADKQPCTACGVGCPGFSQHDWKPQCVHCRHHREEHQLYHSEFVNIWGRLGLDAEADLTESKILAADHGLAWAPPGLNSDQVSFYMESIAPEKVPKLDTRGERYRDLQIVHQIPAQDLSAEFCHSMETQSERDEFEEFLNKRAELALDVAQAVEQAEESLCHKCDRPIAAGSVVISAAKANSEARWHPDCFTCFKCSELLVDLAYCHRQGKLYCVRHYAEVLKPRCSGCEENSSSQFSQW